MNDQDATTSGTATRHTRRKTDRPNGDLLAWEADHGRRSDWDESAAATCQGCHYPNRLSNAFFVLSVQNLYCRRCGKMIDRHGKPVLPS